MLTYYSDGSTYGSEVNSILSRTKELHPQLRDNEIEVLAAFAGLRPSREGGARVEREEIVVDGQTKCLVHNYGAGGTGFQAGFGMALESVSKIEDLLHDIRGQSRQSKL